MRRSNWIAVAVAGPVVALAAGTAALMPGTALTGAPVTAASGPGASGGTATAGGSGPPASGARSGGAAAALSVNGDGGRSGEAAVALVADVLGGLGPAGAGGGDEADATGYAIGRPASGAPTPLAKQTPAQVRSTAVAALNGARSVRVTGAWRRDGRTFTVDVRMSATAAQARFSDGQGWAELRRIGPELYLTLDRRFQTAHQGVDPLSRLRGSWLEVPARFRGFRALSDLTRISSWSAVVGRADATRRGTGSPVAGTPTVTVSGGTAASATVLTVAGRGPAYPLALVSRDRADHFAFTQFNRSVTVRAPASSS